MAKRNQQQPARDSAGRNNPKKSTPTHPTHVHNQGLDSRANSRKMAEEGERRSGSDSNASKHRKDARVHDNDKVQKQPGGHPEAGYDFEQDLRPDNLAGENHGLRNPSTVDFSHSAEDIKGLHTRLADLTDDELKSIVIVKAGSRLEQGAKYIDLNHLEQGEFVAMSNMTAEPGHFYVPKKETDYVLWNRLNQVDNPVRMDESAATNG